MRVGINGLAGIGRLALRAAVGGVFREPSDPRADDRLDIVHVNELRGGSATAAHLLEFDGIHGPDILPKPQRRGFAKEDGEPVIDSAGHRIAQGIPA